MASKKKIIGPVVFMIVLTVIYTFVLAAINESSAGIIKEQEQLRIKRSVLYVLNQPATGSDQAITDLFNQKIEIKTDTARTTYIYKENGVLSGYAFQFQGTGLWGSLTGYIALSSDFTKVLGVDFVAHSETPGLGGRIDEAWFKEQFRGLPVDTVATVKYKPTENAVLDAITGATLTSNAVQKSINSFITDILLYAKEAKL